MNDMLRRMKLWQKFTLLGAIGALLVMAPWDRLVNLTSGEIAVMLAEDAGIDPLRTAIELQKQLQAHRTLSSMVLNGNGSAENDRRSRKAEVNKQFASLSSQLDALGHAPAIAETRTMKAGWEQLSQQVDGRSVSAADSFVAHTALVEQNLQVMDMVADGSGLSLDPIIETRLLVAEVVHGLPRLAESLAVAHDKDAMPPDVRKTFAEPLLHAQRESRRFVTPINDVASTGGGSLAAAEIVQAGSVAVDAQYQLLDVTASQLESLLHDRIQSATFERHAMLAGLAALAILAAGVALATTRFLTRPSSHAVDATAVEPGDLSLPGDGRVQEVAASCCRSAAWPTPTASSKTPEPRAADAGPGHHAAVPTADSP